jgi:hypothetical protein
LCRTKDKKSERKTELEDLVASIVQQSILRAPYLNELVDFIIDQAKEGEGNLTNDNNNIKRMMLANTKKINNLLIAVKQGIISESLQKDLSDLERQNEALRSTIEKNKVTRSISFDKEKLLYFFYKLAERRQDREKQNAIIIKHFVKKVILWDDENITIETTLQSDPVKVNMSDFDSFGVRLNATQFHHNIRNSHPIGFTKPKLSVFRYSIFIQCMREKKEQ